MIGIPALIIASMFFASVSALNRIVPQNVGTFHQLTIRCLIIGAIFLFAGFLLRDIKKIQKKDVPLFIFRGILVTADFSTFFVAVNFLQLGVTLFLFYAGSILANYLYGSFVLHEKLTKIKVISLILALIGLATMYITDFHAFISMFVFFALFSGFAYGLEVGSSKTLEKYSVNQVNAVAFITAGVIGMVLLFLTHESSVYTLFTIPWGSFLIWISVSIVAFYLVIYGYKYVEAQKASLICLSEILFAVLIGLVLYKEVPTFQTVLGGILIIISLALPNLQLEKK